MKKYAGDGSLPPLDITEYEMSTKMTLECNFYKEHRNHAKHRAHSFQNLVAHMRTHVQKGPYYCRIAGCDGDASTLQNLKNHVTKFHKFKIKKDNRVKVTREADVYEITMKRDHEIRTAVKILKETGKLPASAKRMDYKKVHGATGGRVKTTRKRKVGDPFLFCLCIFVMHSWDIGEEKEREAM